MDAVEKINAVKMSALVAECCEEIFLCPLLGCLLAEGADCSQKLANTPALLHQLLGELSKLKGRRNKESV